MSGIDGRVNNVSAGLQRVAKFGEMAARGGNKTAAVARSIEREIMRDGKVDANERDFLNETLKSDYEKIKVSTKEADSDPNAVTFTNKWTSEAQDILENIGASAGNARFESLWNGSANDLAKLAEIANSSPENKSKVQDFLSDKFAKVWKGSRVTNAYAPFVAAVGSITAKLNSLEGAQNEAVRWMVFDAAKAADSRPDMNIPDFLYEPVRPGGIL